MLLGDSGRLRQVGLLKRSTHAGLLPDVRLCWRHPHLSCTQAQLPTQVESLASRVGWIGKVFGTRGESLGRATMIPYEVVQPRPLDCVAVVSAIRPDPDAQIVENRTPRMAT